MKLFKWCLIIGLATTAAHAEKEPGGFLWYEDPKPVQKEEKKPKEETPSAATQPPLTAVARLKLRTEAFEEAKAKAILDPTIKNVDVARRMNNAFIEDASAFQKSWALSEQLDNSHILIKTSPGARKIEIEQREKDTNRKLKEIAKSYGLIFVFKEGCQYSSGAAPLVARFARTFGFEVEGVSSGDSCFEGMTCTGDSLAQKALSPTDEYPFLYMANPNTKEVVPISKGYVSYEELKHLSGQAIQLLERK